MEIARDYYLNKLIERKNNGLIKVITGIRRCGKSYLLNTIFYRYLLSQRIPEDHIIRFAFDSADDLAMIGEDLIELERQKRLVDPKKFIAYIQTKMCGDGLYYLLLDEVQQMESFELVLNGYLAKDNVDVYVTGSNARFLSKDVITEFSGRGDEVRMYPMSFSEFMTVYPGDRYQGLSEYMLYGGIPLVVLRKEPADKAAMLSRLFEEIYLRDIIRRHKVRNAGELGELADFSASAIGSLTNPEKLRRTFKSVKNLKITAVTIGKYLEYMEDSFLLEAAARYDIKGRAYIETPRKYYFTDTGLRNARVNFRQFEQTHLMENVIYNELRLRGYQVDVGVVPVAERSKDGTVRRKQLEVDFVCNLGTSRIYIQSAFSIPDEEKRRQETASLRKIDDGFKKIIITHDVLPAQYDDHGILTINIYDFLLQPDAIKSI